MYGGEAEVDVNGNDARTFYRPGEDASRYVDVQRRERCGQRGHGRM